MKRGNILTAGALKRILRAYDNDCVIWLDTNRRPVEEVRVSDIGSCFVNGQDGLLITVSTEAME